MSAILDEPPQSPTLRRVVMPAGSTSQRPRVCFVGLGNLPVLAREHNHRPIGGEQVQQTLLAKALAAQGYAVSMITADYGQPDGASWHDVKVYKAYALDAGLPVVRFVHPRWSGMWSALKRADADVYYVSCASPIVGEVAMFCQRYDRKFIFRVASDVDCIPEQLIIRYWRDKKLYEYGLRRADGVLVQSQHQQRLLQHNYRVPSSIAGMLVEPAIGYAPFAQRDMTVLWVNNLRQLKRPDLYFDLAQALTQLSFHLAGGAMPGQEAFFERARLQAQSYPNLSFHGHIPYHDVNPLYGRARVLVNTSDIEGFPNSYLQAWAAGTPVVAFFDPDGLIARERLGIAVRTAEELRDAVQELATNESAWLAASQRCRAFMARAYAEEVVLAPYRTLIDMFASRSKS
jgi:glycosyltransferase involved in cell wall biosynthesis